MIVCLCKVASDSKINQAIELGAHSLEQIGQACGAGTGCGACRDHIQGMIDEVCTGCPGGSCANASAACSRTAA